MSTRDFDAAAAMLVEDVVVDSPAGAFRGRDRWLEQLRANLPPDDLVIVPRDFSLEETADGAEVRFVQEFRSKDTNELAYERPFSLRLTIAGDRITRLDRES